MDARESTMTDLDRADEKLSSASRAGLRRPPSAANSADEESAYNLKCMLLLNFIIIIDSYLFT